jgi:hypothetical protein
MVELINKIYPAFITEMVPKGFWWAFLACIINGAAFTIIGLIFGIFSKILRTIVYSIPSTLFTFYIWQVRDKTGWLILAIIAAIGSVIVVIQALLLVTTRKSSGFMENFVLGYSNEINKNLPMDIDADTRFDKSIPLPNSTLQYNFTLKNYAKEELDAEVLRNNMYPSILANIKSNADLEALRSYKVTMIYVYFDKNNNEVLRMNFVPKDYS